VAGEIEHFFGLGGFHLHTLENAQYFDFESLKGRTRSASYTPEPGSPNFEPMFAELEELFNAHEREGIVNFEYLTTVYFGHLTNST